MSTETKTTDLQDTPESKSSAEPVQQERKLTADDLDTEGVHDVKGGGLTYSLEANWDGGNTTGGSAPTHHS